GSSLQIAERDRELFTTVGLDAGAINHYPHAFSGGQRQRIGIARPISLNLMADLQQEFNLTYVFIAHDLGVVRHVSNRVGVIYLGEFVEFGDVGSLYETPLHPYTEALLSVVPELNDTDAPRRERIIITGDVPDPADRPSGCPFHPRCPVATDFCRVEKPMLVT